MDYEKKYNDALEKAKSCLKDGTITNTAIGYIETIFPELLKESEDERIRKEIVRFIQMEVEDEIVGNKWIAWLVKQTNTKVKDFSENREDLSEFYKQVCRMAASLLNKEYDYTMETVEWYAYTLLEYAKKELEKQCEQKPNPKGKSAVEANNEVLFKVRKR